MFGGEKDFGEEEYTTAYETVQDQDAEWDEDGDEVVTEEEVDEDRLDLDSDEEALPWLESSDYAEEDGVDTGRLVGFVLLGLLALGLLVGGIWFLTNRGPDPELVADGSTIEAPEGDYKRKPDEAGGREFPGTGDVAPAVGEGQTREGRLADGNAAGATGGPVRPSVDAPGTGSNASAEQCEWRRDHHGQCRRRFFYWLKHRFEHWFEYRAKRSGRRLFEQSRSRSRLEPARTPDQRTFGCSLSHCRRSGRYRQGLPPAGNARRCWPLPIACARR